MSNKKKKGERKSQDEKVSPLPFVDNLQEFLKEEKAEKEVEDGELKDEGKGGKKASLDLDSREKLEKKLVETQKELLYLRAEFENHRKNAIKERSELVKYGAKPLFSSLLNVMDLFEQALKVEIKQENLESVKKGVEMIFLEFQKTLENFGLKEISIEKGSLFNPREQEALMRKSSSDVPPGSVIEVHRRAYKLYDHVVRPAQVSVSSKSDKEQVSSSETKAKATGQKKEKSKEKTE